MVQSDIQKIIENLLNVFEPKAVAIESEVRQTPGSGASKAIPSMTIVQSYEATTSGRRYYEETATGEKGIVLHRAAYCDGEKCTNINYQPGPENRQRSVAISNQFLQEGISGFLVAPDPWTWSHVGLTPLHEALATAKPLGEGEVIGRKTHVFQISRRENTAASRDWIYHLDQATSVPLRVEFYTNPDRIEAKRPDTIWEAVTLDVVATRSFPMRSKMVQSAVRKEPDGTEKLVEQLRRETTIKSIYFDSPIPATRFVAKIEPGMPVSDMLNKTIKVTPGVRIPIEPPRKPVEGNATVATPAVVEPASDPSLWLSGIGVTLSVGVLIVAFVLWRRSSS